MSESYEIYPTNLEKYLRSAFYLTKTYDIYMGNITKYYDKYGNITKNMGNIARTYENLRKNRNFFDLRKIHYENLRKIWLRIFTVRTVRE